MANIIQHKRGTAAQWSSLNPLLANGELGLETDTLKFKFGDGVNYWNALGYAGGGGGDLSNYYTKAEVDSLLSKKESSFTTEAPLEMNTITRGGIYNITTNTPFITNIYQTALTFDGNTSGTVAISNSAISNSPSTLSEFFTGNCSYFDIPTTAGTRIANGESFVDKVWLNCGAIDSNYYPMFIWGYKGVDDEFIPVVFQQGYYSGGMFSGFVGSVSNADTNTINLNCTAYSDSSTSESGNTGYGWRSYLQYTPSSQTVTTEIDRQNNTVYDWNGCSTQNSAILEKAKRINVVRVFSYQNGGYPPTVNNTTYSINNIDTGWSVTDEAVSTSSLSLKFDNNTIVLNSNNELEVNRGSGYEIGDVIWRLVPTQDSGKHLLDGALIDGSGSYAAFVTYIAGLVTDYPDLFVTEADWQTSVTTYGVCGKFVYDDVNNTVRLPKYNSKIYTGGGTAPVVGNGITLGLTDGKNTAGLRTFFENNRYTLSAERSCYDLNVGSTQYSGSFLGDVSIGVTTDGLKSGLIAQLSNITTSLDGYYYIVVATSTKTDIQVDIDEIATDLNGKADVDLSNMSASQSAKNTIITWGMPDWNNAIEITSSFPYTCPSNGYLYLSIYNGYIEITSNINTSTNGYKIVATSNQVSNVGMFPVQLNEILTSNASTGTKYMYFIPMKGVN